MIHYKSKAEIELMRESSLLVSKTLALVAAAIKPGITTLQLNELAGQFISDHKATPSFKGYNGFPFACCISVNDAVVHGFPSKNELKDGDVISVDIGVFKNGFHGDSAYTFAVGEVSAEIKQLLQVTKASLYKGIDKAVHGSRVGDIAYAILIAKDIPDSYSRTVALSTIVQKALDLDRLELATTAAESISDRYSRDQNLLRVLQAKQEREARSNNGVQPTPKDD